MPRKKHKTEIQTLEDFRVALTNAVNQSEIATILAEFGYDSEEIAKGSKLLKKATDTYNLNKQEDNETIEARADFDTKVEELEELYSMHRKKGKVVFRKDELVLQKLGLSGSLPRSYVKRIEAIQIFYTELQADAILLDKLARLKITIKDIRLGLALISSIQQARTLYLREIGESQDATKTKDSAFAQLDDWMRDFFAVAKIAMEDNPQLLEALGILVRS